MASTAAKRLLVLNPNTSSAFTEKIARVAARCAIPDTVEIETAQPKTGPRSIESVYDELLSSVPSLEAYLERAAARRIDGVVVACFSDHPVQQALREVGGRAAVVGLLDASLAAASLAGDRVGIVTTSAGWEPLLRSGVDRLGYGDRCRSIVAVCVEINHWFGGSPPNFRTLYLGQIEVDSADFWTNRLLSSSSRSTAESLASKPSHKRKLKSG